MRRTGIPALKPSISFPSLLTHRTAPRSPKRLQLIDPKAKPQVALSLTLGADDDTEALLPQHHHSGLERRARSWSGTKFKDDRALASPTNRLAALFDEERPPCAPALKEARPTTPPPKKERSGFLVPFFRRINTPDPEKNKQPAWPPPLARSISAADLTCPLATGSEGQPEGAVRKRPSSTDQKVVRFASAENTWPYLGGRGWASGDGNGDGDCDGDAAAAAARGGGGVAPLTPYYSPETTPTTPASTNHRGGHFLLRGDEGEYRQYNNAAAAAAAAPGPLAEGNLLLDMSAVARKPCEANQAVVVSLRDFPRVNQPYPSPVSPPDPEYIRQVEAALEASFTTDHSRALGGEGRQQSIPPWSLPELEPAYELDVSQMTGEQVYEKLVGPVGNWFHYPPMQVAEEFVPKSKAHWDWRALEIRGRDQFSGLGLSFNDGSGFRWPATF